LQKRALNEHPSEYSRPSTHFILIGQSMGGHDAERHHVSTGAEDYGKGSLQIKSIEQGLSIIAQTAMSLMVSAGGKYTCARGQYQGIR
jgi:hypothetical protein